MPRYIVLVESTVLTNYDVVAKNEDEATELVLNGEYDDATLADEYSLDVIEVERLGQFDEDYDEAKSL